MIKLKMNKKGFSIIELVLVLAIAGLIFLMVFVVLPTLQRSQRNTRRRQDMSRILAAFDDYKANNGHYPSSRNELNDLIGKYIGASDGTNYQEHFSDVCIGDKFCDPDGSPYQIDYYSISSHFSKEGDVAVIDSENYEDHFIYYRLNAKCLEETSGYSSGADDIAINYILEGGVIYCGDNQ